MNKPKWLKASAGRNARNLSGGGPSARDELVERKIGDYSEPVNPAEPHCYAWIKEDAPELRVKKAERELDRATRLPRHRAA
jgi:hypothetical protein